MTEKYLDFSFEKTNSAYMLFYERRVPDHIKNRLQKDSKSLHDQNPVASTSKESSIASNNGSASSLSESIEIDNVEKDNFKKCDIESKNSFKTPSSPSIGIPSSVATPSQKCPEYKTTTRG